MHNHSMPFLDLPLDCLVHLMPRLLEGRAGGVCLPSVQGGQAPRRAGYSVVRAQALGSDPSFFTY